MLNQGLKYLPPIKNGHAKKQYLAYIRARGGSKEAVLVQ